MWTPDSIQISRELINAELEGKIPAGTSMAAAAFMMNGATKETAKRTVERFSLDRAAAKVAWIFLSKGQIVTSDGEILTATSEVASPATPVEPNPPTDSSDSKNDSVVEAVRVVFKRHFPNWVEPTSEQAMNIMRKARDIEIVDNALYNMANGNTEIKNPITLCLWILNNKSPEEIAQEREILDRKGRSGDSIVREAMRKAEAEIPNLPTPKATNDTVDLLRQFKDRVERARN